MNQTCMKDDQIQNSLHIWYRSAYILNQKRAYILNQASYKTRNGNGETKRNETNGTGNHTQNIDSADRAACLRWTRL